MDIQYESNNLKDKAQELYQIEKEHLAYSEELEPVKKDELITFLTNELEYFKNKKEDIVKEDIYNIIDKLFDFKNRLIK